MSAIALAAPKLGPLVRLLASNRDGEVLAAARGLQRVLATNGLDLNDLADLIERSAVPIEPEPEPERPASGACACWVDQVNGLLAHGAQLLDERDLLFLRTIRRAAMAGREPSEKQVKWLDDIHQKLKARAYA